MSDAVASVEAIDSRVLLSVLAQVKEGDLAARMPVEWTGVAGKVADGLNDVILENQALSRMLGVLAAVKAGDFSARLPLGWTGVAGKVADGLNDLIFANQALDTVLGVLAEVRAGDFSARMPLGWTGVAGKVADGLNEVIVANQALGAELARVSRVVGTQGELSQRVALGGLDAVLVWERRVGQQPDRRPGAADQRDAAGDRRGGRRRSEQEGVGRRAGRDAGSEEHHQRHGRPAQRVRFRADPGGPGGRAPRASWVRRRR